MNHQAPSTSGFLVVSWEPPRHSWLVEVHLFLHLHIHVAFFLKLFPVSHVSPFRRTPVILDRCCSPNTVQPSYLITSTAQSYNITFQIKSCLRLEGRTWTQNLGRHSPSPSHPGRWSKIAARHAAITVTSKVFLKGPSLLRRVSQSSLACKQILVLR